MHTELKRQRTIHLRSRRPHRLEENEDDDNIDNEREKEGLERVEGIFLSFYSAIRKNMRDKANDADWSDEYDEKIRMKNLSKILRRRTMFTLRSFYRLKF